MRSTRFSPRYAAGEVWLGIDPKKKTPVRRGISHVFEEDVRFVNLETRLAFIAKKTVFEKWLRKARRYLPEPESV